MYAVVSLWKFGLQCPTSPLLPPRKVPLEDLIYTSCTDPIPQPAAARTPRLHQPSAVTHLFYAYVRKATDTEFNVFMFGRDRILLFAQLLSFLRHNTSRNSWFTFIAIAGKKCLRLVVQTLVLQPGDVLASGCPAGACVWITQRLVIFNLSKRHRLLYILDWLNNCSSRLDAQTTVALDCMYCSLRLVLIFDAQRLLTADCDDIIADVIIADPSTDSADVTAADPSCCAIPLVLEHYNRAPETDLNVNTINHKGMYDVVCLWKFGLQCPTSPLLPPRKVPLEDLIYTSCTDPIPQPAAARTPRLHQPSAVTHLFYAYVRNATDTEFNFFVLGRDLI
ncbi:hypothetical protein F511_23274 [Dorcoceras hygrometricum]|uniref:Uncharacterized protein n=1 Tax=Dorcoceras hygrometricum TaxID=472368 RepID=A0A2Z7BV01_9LAMI|nr:hypothetical protein F511_23274 [Dorcoceras hygrometricum]